MKNLALMFLLLMALPLAALAAEPAGLDNTGLQKLINDNKGKVIMLNFFATWCPPCRAEIPQLIKLRQDFPKDKLLIIGLSVDDKAATVAPFIKSTGIDYPVYMADRSITDAFNISSVPHNAFFAKNGELVISEPGLAEAKVLDQVVGDLSR